MGYLVVQEVGGVTSTLTARSSLLVLGGLSELPGRLIRLPTRSAAKVPVAAEPIRFTGEV
jgi:hypothetical protein